MPRWAVVLLSLLAGAVAIFAISFVVFGTGEEIAGSPVFTGETVDDPMTIRIRLRGGEPVGGVQRLTMERGETVSIRVVSDVADELHVHGYDLTGELAPGGTSELEFEATIAGRFEIELEHSGTPIAELEVRP